MDKESKELLLENIVFGSSSLRKRKRVFDDSDDEEIIKKGLTENLKPVWSDSDDEEKIEVSSVKNNAGLKFNKLKESYNKCNIANNSWADISQISEPKEVSEFNHVVSDYLAKKSDLHDPWNMSIDENLLKYKWVGNMRNCSKTNDTSIYELPGTMSAMKKHNMSTKGGRITSIKFHPHFQILCVTDVNGTFHLHSVENKACGEILKLDLKKFAISSCEFLSISCEEIIFVASNAWFLYNFDLRTEKMLKFYWKKRHSTVVPKKINASFDGKYFVLYGNNSGQILLFSQNAKEHLTTFYANSNLCSVTFSLDSKHLLALTGDGEMYVWDMSYYVNQSTPPLASNIKNVVKFSDRGNYQATSMSLAPNGDYLATGSDSGVVNLYDMSAWMKRVSLAKGGEVKAPPLIKSWKNITTPVTLLDINPQSDVLIMGSSYSKDCVKIANLNKRSIYTNFPNNRARLSFRQNVYASAFSPSSGYLALGSDYGNVNLYRLHTGAV